jgi:serine/threonine-protein kinase
MLAPGLVVHTYVLERLVGSGGTSQVWAARDTRSGEVVALKVLRTRSGQPESAAERLVREARATRAIKHPAVVPVREVIQHEGVPVLVMDLLCGETLREHLMRESRLSVSRAAVLLLPVAEALSEAHHAGIAHRDLKPENIFLQAPFSAGEGESPTVRLLDFGVARFFEPVQANDLTPITGLEMLLGTLCYMAPEQALRPAEADQRVDVWAFGVTLYEALSGCRPIEGESPQDTLRQLLVGCITPVDVLVPDIPGDLSEVLSQFLVRRPEARAPGLARAVDVLRKHLPVGGG